MLNRCGGVGGKPGPCPGEHGDHDKKAEGKLKSWAKALAKLPGKIGSAVKTKAKAVYSKLEAKYGPKHAKAILAIGVLTLPVPGSTIAMLGVCGLASLSNKIVGKRMKRANDKHKEDGTFDHTPGNKQHAKNLAKCAAVLNTLTPKTKKQVQASAQSLFAKLQQPDKVLGVALATMPYPTNVPQVLTAGALALLHIQNSNP